jgi:hypothetical protein
MFLSTVSVNHRVDRVVISVARLQNPAEFRPEWLHSVPIQCFCPWNYGIYYMYIPAFSGVLSLCHCEPDILHNPPLRSVPRPIGEGLSIAFWALRLLEKLFLRKLTLSNFKLSFELKKKQRK